MEDSQIESLRAQLAEAKEESAKFRAIAEKQTKCVETCLAQIAEKDAEIARLDNEASKRSECLMSLAVIREITGTQKDNLEATEGAIKNLVDAGATYQRLWFEAQHKLAAHEAALVKMREAIAMQVSRDAAGRHNAAQEALSIQPTTEFLEAYIKERVGEVTEQRNELLTAIKTIKSNLMHTRRFGVDTLTNWRNAAARAEGDLEEAIASVEKGN